MTNVYVGLGGNLGSPEAIRARFAAAAEAIAVWPEVSAVRLSPIYRTAPVGPVADQPHFQNAALEITLARPLPPVLLLARLLDLERDLGRDRAASVPQGPRAIDLDLLLHGDTVCDDPGPPPTRVPHPRLHERAFALKPLIDLAGPDLVIPDTGRTAGAYLADLNPVFAALGEADQVVAVAVDHDEGDGDAEGDLGVGAGKQ